MIKIRANIFETNSSSIHTIVVLTNEQYKALSDGAYILCNRDTNNANNVKITYDVDDVESSLRHNFDGYIVSDCEMEKICAFDDYLVFSVEMFEI